MHPDLIEVGWTDDHWNRICTVVSDEAQRARVGAQFLPISGPELRSAVAIPSFRLDSANPSQNPYPFPPRGQVGAAPGASNERLSVNSMPDLPLTCFSVNVQLRSHEVADPEMSAALVMFRRAANLIARLEDALIFNGRPRPNANPAFVGPGVPNVFSVSGDGQTSGLLSIVLNTTPVTGAIPFVQSANRGNAIVTGIIRAITQLEAAAQTGPFACVLANDAFESICTPTAALVLPRDRILPFLQGPLLRSSVLTPRYGVVVALGGAPLELVVASDIHVRFLQTTLEPRYVFRVSERVALRIKDEAAIVPLTP